MSVGNTKMLENYISYCSAKNKAISKNIANVGTENYKKQDVVFKNILQDSVNSSLKATSQKHIGFETANKSPNDFDIIEDNGTEMFSGVNNVDIDSEMADLAENSIKFKFAAKKLASFYRDLQGVIKGAR